MIARVVAHGQVGAEWQGTVTPGHPLTVRGDLEVAEDGSVAASLFQNEEEPQPAKHVQVVVEGTASLAGTFVLSRNGRRVDLGDSYALIKYRKLEGRFLQYAGLDAGGGLEFKPDYSVPNLFMLTSETAVPPRLVAKQPLHTAYQSIDTVSVEFSEPMDPESFMSSDVVLKDPDGKRIPIQSIVADPVTIPVGPKFLIRFAAQVRPGTYSVTLGPEISDFAGYPMVAAESWMFDLMALAPPSPRIDWLPPRRVMVRWTIDGGPEFDLETTLDLGKSTPWIAVAAPVEQVGAERRVVLDAAEDMAAFRLRSR